MKCTVPIITLLLSVAASAAEIHVRPEGPIRTLAEAQREARKTQATVVIHAGTYYLPETLVFNSAAVCHDILHFRARVVDTVATLPLASGQFGGFKRQLWREIVSIWVSGIAVHRPSS